MPDANLFVEKRAHPRVPVKIPVKFRLVEDLAGIQSIIEMRKTESHTQTLDISLGGMYLVADQRLNRGSILHLDFTLPGTSKRLMAFGEVVWSKESGAGLHFMTIKSDDLEALEAFLGESSPQK